MVTGGDEPTPAERTRSRSAPICRTGGRQLTVTAGINFFNCLRTYPDATWRALRGFPVHPTHRGLRRYFGTRARALGISRRAPLLLLATVGEPGRFSGLFIGHKVRSGRACARRTPRREWACRRGSSSPRARFGHSAARGGRWKGRQSGRRRPLERRVRRIVHMRAFCSAGWDRTRTFAQPRSPPATDRTTPRAAAFGKPSACPTRGSGSGQFRHRARPVAVPNRPARPTTTTRRAP